MANLVLTYTEEQKELMRLYLTKPDEAIPLPEGPRSKYWVVEFLRNNHTKTECTTTLCRDQGAAQEIAYRMYKMYMNTEIQFAVAVPVYVLRRSV